MWGCGWVCNVRSVFDLRESACEEFQVTKMITMDMKSNQNVQLNLTTFVNNTDMFKKL